MSQQQIDNDVFLLKFFNNNSKDDISSKSGGPGGVGNKINENGTPQPSGLNAPGSNKDEPKKKTSDFSPIAKLVEKVMNKAWNICVVNDTPEKRSDYCKVKFSVSNSAKRKCENDFCKTCCVKSAAVGNLVQQYACNKTCNKFTAKSPPQVIEDNWKATCINPTNMSHNIYTYCDRTFGNEKLLRHNCSLDSCRLCCAIQDNAFKNVNANLLTQSSCNQSCADKFKYTK